MPRITTILPTYNRSTFLKRALDTVRSQTWQDLKIVVRDNCSMDDTESVVSTIASDDSRVVYEKQINNIGSHENIRQGIKSVNTEYFSFLCDDDYLEPEFYSEALNLFDQYPNAGFIAFRVDTVDLDGKIIHSNMKNSDGPTKATYYNSKEGIDAYLRGFLPYTLTGYIFRKDVAHTIDFGEFSEVGYGADIFFIWHAASRYNFVVTNSKGGNFTTHSNSTSSKLVKVFDERFLYWWRNRMLIIINDPQVSNEVKNKISKYYLTHSTKSFHSFKYYMRAATLLMMDRIKKRQFDELKFDFIQMRSFVSWPILVGIKYSVVFLVYLRLDNKSFSLMQLVSKVRSVTCIFR
jgi:glycosyltransferase involved in cell wall biosynthesis